MMSYCPRNPRALFMQSLLIAVAASQIGLAGANRHFVGEVLKLTPQ